MSIWLGDKKLAGISVKQSHNIGDIFFTSRTDTVLAGAVECNGATYQTTSYTGEGSIGELLRAGKLPYISLSQYASDLAAHGSVRAFGWDGGNTTVFRVPTLQNVFLEAGQAASAGEYISAGLPNITGNLALGGSHGFDAFSEYSGAFAADTTFRIGWQAGTVQQDIQNKHGRLGFNASRSSSIYGNSTTVQPNSVKYRAMVQLYNGVTDEALATCENVEGDVQSLKTTLDNKITNCITNIPQDIKLELNNGKVTLKAGSKVYIPNGVGVFDSITISADNSTRGSDSNASYLVCCDESGLMIYHPLGNCVSGAGATTTHGFAYNTTTNEIYYYNYGSVATIKCSLPIGIISTDANGYFVSIDRVFNGFGYIGSTVFALPGVKGLIPDGRNADGSLKNTTTNDFTTVKTVQVNTSTAKIAMYSGGGLGSQTKNFELNEPENYNYDNGVLSNSLEVARVIVDSNAKITAFTSKTAFHAVDYNDSEYIAHQAMPSLRYIDLTLATSGSTYTAPADGYFSIQKQATGSGQFLSICKTPGNSYGMKSTADNTYTLRCFLPVAKGMTVEITYNAGGATQEFRFIYANGSK